MNIRFVSVIFALAMASCSLQAAPQSPDNLIFTQSFGEQKADLVPTGRNPFFILEPGYVQTLEGNEDDAKVVLTITVLDETKKVDGIETRIVEERESEDGKIIEISRNYFAISKRTNSVYYFGEDSKTYKNGKVTGTGGSWESGKNGAVYGMMMPGVPLVGARYYQEIAPGEAMDRAEIVSTTDTLTVPAGVFSGVLKTCETTPLEPGSKEYKFYAAGIGLIKDGSLGLVRYGFGAVEGKAESAPPDTAGKGNAAAVPSAHSISSASKIPPAPSVPSGTK